ncbi:ankyrin repeat domain-containing protein [Archangium violaceum]|uniref:Uncharacterized protein n=1 Tax=Archangium violaceum Cb vi76 TaxID=1406225 RepID=A0A084SFU0_9BACT|nr:ankyrin repeat domain-containing protein [Archangium violaceum]KFA87325.1 hypothetical protein Q664_48680 [Archangium violaceum Cb vi76]
MGGGRVTVVNAWDVKRDLTPLWVAICEQEVVALEVLVRAGADPNVRSSEGIMPLRACAEVGSLSMAALLLYAGAAQTINDWGGLSGYTALGHAARRLDLPMSKRLLAAGADPRAPDEDGRPAHYRLPPRAESDSQTWDAAFELLGGAKDRMPFYASRSQSVQGSVLSSKAGGTPPGTVSPDLSNNWTSS